MIQMLKTKITEMFGIKHPIASAAMGPFKTTELCIAVAEAGGLGMLSHTPITPTGEMANYNKAMIENLDFAVAVGAPRPHTLLHESPGKVVGQPELHPRLPQHQRPQVRRARHP